MGFTDETIVNLDTTERRSYSIDEKDGQGFHSYVVHEDQIRHGSVAEVDMAEVVIPDDDDEFIDPRLKDYPVPLVAKTVDLHDGPTFDPSSSL